MRVKVLDVFVDNLTMDEAIVKAQNLIDLKKGGYIITPNPEIILDSYYNSDLKEALLKADLLVPDGIGVVYASKIYGTPLKERVAGFDLINNLLKKRALNIYLFGSKEGVAQKAGKKIKELYPHTNIVGAQNGYFDEIKEKEIIEDIKEKSPDLILVCLGAPKQEKWILKNKDLFENSVLIGAGGSLDVLAGNVKRAPDIFIKLNLEWFYRLIKEPTRLKRMLKLPKFILVVILKRIKEGKGKYYES